MAPSRDFEGLETASSHSDLPVTQQIPLGQLKISSPSHSLAQSHQAEISNVSDRHNNTQPFDDAPKKADRGSRVPSASSHSSRSSDRMNPSTIPELQVPRTTELRPHSMLTLGSELSGFRSRTQSPHLSVTGTPSPTGSPRSHARAHSSSRPSPDSRPVSYIDLLNTTYPQPMAPLPNFDNGLLRTAVGTNLSLLDTKKTMDMYRANVKKTNDSAVQHEFAVYMTQAACQVDPNNPDVSAADLEIRNDLLREARQLLVRLSNHGYPFSQYYLGDGFWTGVFNKGKPDEKSALDLFQSASKHGHAEGGYRAGLCYEHGWGCNKNYPKAAQYYRASASKNHPGAATRLGRACLTGDWGLSNRQREGLKWMKRAAENADVHFNDAPFELGLLHEHGYGEDIFKDEAYAAELFTRAAELGHADANLRMGEAYEKGLLACPRDAALSVHYYNGAAEKGLAKGMMGLCAWYLVGAAPVLEQDLSEAYEWAMRAAQLGYTQGIYSVGWFTEMGIGTRRDPLEANVWYVRAAEMGDDRATRRLKAIREAAAGSSSPDAANGDKKAKKGFFSKLGLS
ncbi:HCP-like protein [Aulographum hederae CBS 113979]|uniref:HCP-like protein n=1 Tax=Aulographum hederae CBS 113979 TaxID=1176131 RepID=A0A6G1HG98_9PEZI|nr:HCP-like protein [Aulographum hederae CBS 113979]